MKVDFVEKEGGYPFSSDGFLCGAENYCYDSLLFFSFGLLFSFLAITHPSHIIGPLTTLIFVIASFYLILRTSMTHLCLLTVLLCDSIAFHHVPSVLSLFWTFLSLRYINSRLAMYSLS